MGAKLTCGPTLKWTYYPVGNKWKFSKLYPPTWVIIGIRVKNFNVDPPWWTYVQRTMPGISSLFLPLEDCISDVFIPAITGRCSMSPVERDMLALPVRFGGLGISNPVECCDREYQSSLHITRQLSNLIFQQEQDLSLFSPDNQITLILWNVQKNCSWKRSANWLCHPWRILKPRDA